MWICDSEEQFCLVPVGADWTNREPLLGFPNSLEKENYIIPETGVLKLIIEASKEDNANKPYFIILDEMNLSHVERYFADFLSVIESRNNISLHSGNTAWNEIPPKITFPKNLFVVGTVNIDETTYMFSPKVLDRANVIEFRVTKKEIEEYLDENLPLNLEALKGAGSHMAESFIKLARDETLKAKEEEGTSKTLLSFFEELKAIGAEFGYRTASEILRFVAVINKMEPGWKTNDIVDAAIMQKLLPKVHGSKRKLEPVLKTLAKLCLEDEKEIENYIIKKNEDFSKDPKVKFPISLEKIVRMYDNLMSNGFTSYAEA
jgi:5-methylcytosine-specific restriction protein B